MMLFLFSVQLRNKYDVEQKDDNDWVEHCMTWEVEGIRQTPEKDLLGL